MIDSKWFCEPNDYRESWCFLKIYQTQIKNESIISGWELGYGNPNQLTRIIKNENIDEKEIIRALFKEIFFCRKNKIKLITYEQSIPLLRSRVLFLKMQEISLKGISFICILNLLKQYFSINDMLFQLAGKMKIKIKGIKEIEIIRNIFIRIGPLLPEGVI